MQLDRVDREIIRLLSEDGRATYSHISKTVGVSVGTVRNRVTALRDSGVLHLNVWIDPYRVGLGITATFLIRVEAGSLTDVVERITELESTGYVAVIAGDHDLMVDAFFRDVPHLNHVLHEEVQQIDGVASVTSYLVTDIKYESNLNVVSLLEGETDAGHDAPARLRGGRPEATG